MFDLMTSERCALAESSKIKGTDPWGWGGLWQSQVLGVLYLKGRPVGFPGGLSVEYVRENQDDLLEELGCHE